MLLDSSFDPYPAQSHLETGLNASVNEHSRAIVYIYVYTYTYNALLAAHQSRDVFIYSIIHYCHNLHTFATLSLYKKQ